MQEISLTNMIFNHRDLSYIKMSDAEISVYLSRDMKFRKNRKKTRFWRSQPMLQ